MPHHSLGSCAFCGEEFHRDHDIVFHDKGRLCTSCADAVDLAQVEKKSWSGESSAIASTPILLGVVSWFCFNPFYLTSIATLFASVTAIVLATRKRMNADAPPWTRSQRIKMAAGGVIGLVLAFWWLAVVVIAMAVYQPSTF